MNTEINEVREFIKWARENTGKYANFTIKFWRFSCDNCEKIKYEIYVEDIINKSSENLLDLLDRIPKFKQLCLLAMEVAS